MNKRTHLITLSAVLLIAVIEGVLLLYPSHASNLNITTGKADYKINQGRGLAKKSLEQEHGVAQVAQSGILPPNNPSKSLVPNPAFTSQCSYNENDEAT